MGVKQSHNFAQEVMEDIFCDMADVKVYRYKLRRIKNAIGIFAQNWEHHQTILWQEC
jgi:hypothetical protein